MISISASPLSSLSFSINIVRHNPSHKPRGYLLRASPHPIKVFFLKCEKLGCLHQNWLEMKMWGIREKGLLTRIRVSKDGTFWGEEKYRRGNRVVKVKFNQGFGFNGGGGGGGGRRDDGTTARVLGNLALAVGLTYLSMTGQLGWVLDAIVSLWLLAFVIPIIGIGAFLWWAGRDMIQGTCPNCRNAFQVFKSSLNDELQLCPFCSQPFSVERNKFVKEPIKFSSKHSDPFGQTFGDFSSWSNEGKDTSTTVDVEAEVKDVE